MALAYRVTWWRCDADGDLYWTTPRDPIALVTLMSWHIHGAHPDHAPPGRWRQWIVYVNETYETKRRISS